MQGPIFVRSVHHTYLVPSPSVFSYCSKMEIHSCVSTYYNISMPTIRGFERNLDNNIHGGTRRAGKILISRRKITNGTNLEDWWCRSNSRISGGKLESWCDHGMGLEKIQVYLRSIKCKLTQGKSKATVLVTHLRPDLLEPALEISSMDLVSHLGTFALTNISDCKMSLNDCTPRGNTFWNWTHMNIREKKHLSRQSPPASLTNCMMHVHDVRKATMWLCETVAIWF